MKDLYANIIGMPLTPPSFAGARGGERSGAEMLKSPVSAPILNTAGPVLLVLEGGFDRYGGWLIVFSRFFDGTRQLNGIAAGVLAMPWARFTDRLPHPGPLPEGEGDEGRAKRDVQGAAWSERPLPLAVLRSFDADLTLKADLVAAKRIQAKDVRGRILLENGRLRLEGFSASLPGLPLTGQAALDAAAQPPALDLTLASERVQLPQALSFLSPSSKTDGTLRTLVLKAKAQGDSPTALGGSDSRIWSVRRFSSTSPTASPPARGGLRCERRRSTCSAAGRSTCAPTRSSSISRPLNARGSGSVC